MQPRPFLVAAALLSIAAALPAGQRAPDFARPASNGKTITLKEFKGRTVVLAFFPKAFTGGWTRELSGFRDIAAKFADANAQVLGISTDDIETQKKFAESLKLPFPLLADHDGSVSKAYGVWSDGYAQRVTFVIAGDGTIEKVLSGKDALDPSPALASCPLHRPK